MDTNNWSPQPRGGAGEPALNSGDWRAQLQGEFAKISLQPDSPQWIVNKMDVSSNDRQPTQMPQQLMGQQSNAANMQQSQLIGLQNSVVDPDSTAQTGQPDGGDWQEEVYQKIKAMKEMYLPEMNEVYQKLTNIMQQHDSLPQQPGSLQSDKLKIFKTMLERIIMFLQVSKSDISPGFKDKLGSYEKQIMNFINVNRPRQPAPTMQQGQLPPPHMQSVLQQHPTVLRQAPQPQQAALIHQQPTQMPQQSVMPSQQQLMGHLPEASSNQIHEGNVSTWLKLG